MTSPNFAQLGLDQAGQFPISFRTWTASYNRLLTGKDKQFRGPGQWATYDYPNPVAYPRLEQTWLAHYNWNLLGKDKLPNRNIDWSPLKIPPRLDQTWLASYNKNLIGKDKLPFNQKDWPNPKEFRLYKEWIQAPVPTLRIPYPFEWGYQPPNYWDKGWIQPGNALTATSVAIPNNQDDWPNPRPVTWYREWIETGNALTPAKVLPLPFDWGYQEKSQWYRDWSEAGNVQGPFSAAPFSQTDWPLSRDPREKRSWESWYNLNLIGKDIVPGKSYTERPTPVIWYRDQSIPVPPGSLLNPFRQTDHPNPKDYLRVTPSWSWQYNLNLIGKDQLPVGGIVYDRQPPVTWYKDWSQSPKPVVAVTSLPFNQSDWPLSRDPRDKRTWEWWYNLNLIGKDQLPQNSLITSRPNPVIWYQNWIQNSPQVVQDTTHQPLPFDWGTQDRPTWYKDYSQNPALYFIAAPTPFSQTDWPLPKDYLRVTPSWTASYNQNLIGKDIVPGKLLTGRPDPVLWYQNWIQGPIPPAPPFPFNQEDWPLTGRYPRPEEFWAWWYNLNLIGQDQLPVGVIFTDRTPPGNTWNLGSVLNLVETTLRTTAQPFPNQDWPLPSTLRWYQDYNQNLILVAPSSIPPPPTSVDVPSGRVPKDYPHTWTWTDVEIPPAYRAIWKDEFKGQAQVISEAAARLGRKGGIASGISRRK